MPERPGHTDAAMTPNAHNHLFPDPEQRAGAGVGRAFGALAGGSAPNVLSRPEGREDEQVGADVMGEQCD
ncbi:hypothetical protein [Streptomyces sp. NPDC050388]|uniref:hypothetical protein n=1 Tax=Streptomyces sp. NPDC050388 TaxID=3155781 RepID=UPI00343F70F4